MFPVIDYSRVEAALARPQSWIELALIGVCLAIGWLADRRVRVRADDAHEVLRVGAGGVNRLIFPLVSVAALAVATFFFRRYHAPFFLPIALPLVVALAVIRLLVYALRGIFGRARWLATSERAVSFTVWGLVVLYFLGVLQDIGADLDALHIPVGKTHVTVLEIGKALLTVALTLSLTLWISSLLERRLMHAESLDSSLRALAAKSVRAVLLLVAVLMALNAVGLDLTLLSVFGGLRHAGSTLDTGPALRTLPHRHGCDGFYAVVLERAA